MATLDDGNKESNYSEELSKSSLMLSVQLLDDSYKRSVDQIRSLQTRSGVGLGILVAAASGLLVRFTKFLPLLESVEQQRCVFLGLIGISCLIFALFSFTVGFFNESLPDVYDEEALLNSEDGLWLATVQDLQVFRLEWLSDGIKELTAIAKSQIWSLRSGVIATLIGVSIFIAIEVAVRYSHPMLAF